ncbi:MAG: arginyltransferase [Planctomycetes bacterium]|nr:arginyltransferase [Planctomycetota bacterium]
METVQHPNDGPGPRWPIDPASLMHGPAHPCSYLAGRWAESDWFVASQLPAGAYHSLMDLNFRRSGALFYRAACDGCQECKAIRVAVQEFQPNRSQRRCWRRNQDITVSVGPPVPTEDKLEVYQRYLRDRHDREMGGSWSEFCAFLYNSPLHTREVVYRQAGQVLAAGIVDVEPHAVSTVYCYYDPDASGRALGVFNVLWTIDWCRRKQVPYVYLGYFVRECNKMNYKAHYRPCELLEPDGRWRRMADE